MKVNEWIHSVIKGVCFKLQGIIFSYPSRAVFILQFFKKKEKKCLKSKMSVDNIDVHDLVTRWAKDFYKRKAAGRKERKIIEKERLGVEIKWDKVIFKNDAPVYSPPPPKPEDGYSGQNCLFHTTFSNKTDKAQTYNFNATRSTRSSCTVEFEKSFTHGAEFGISLKTPCEILEANAGFHRELTITNLSGETVEEELVWGVNSDVEVSGQHKAEAKMIIREQEYKGTFSMQTSISGRIRIVFTDLKANNEFIKGTETDVTTVFEWARANRLIPTDDSNAIKKNSVLLFARGKCNFKYGLRQDVEVDQTPL